VEDDGAVLVRPDGYVAWRRAHRASDARDALGVALASVLGRDAVVSRPAASTVP
jgi:hypothetical protein